MTLPLESFSLRGLAQDIECKNMAGDGMKVELGTDHEPFDAVERNTDVFVFGTDNFKVGDTVELVTKYDEMTLGSREVIKGVVARTFTIQSKKWGPHVPHITINNGKEAPITKHIDRIKSLSHVI